MDLDRGAIAGGRDGHVERGRRGREVAVVHEPPGVAGGLHVEDEKLAPWVGRGAQRRRDDHGDAGSPPPPRRPRRRMTGRTRRARPAGAPLHPPRVGPVVDEGDVGRSASGSTANAASRSRWAARTAYNVGFGRPATSMIAHEMEGQQSLICHATAPEQVSCCERRCVSPTHRARAPLILPEPAPPRVSDFHARITRAAASWIAGSTTIHDHGTVPRACSASAPDSAFGAPPDLTAHRFDRLPDHARAAASRRVADPRRRPNGVSDIR